MFVSFISLQLGIFNLLPIPILDGGVILLLLVESLMRRDLSLEVKERFVQVGNCLPAASGRVRDVQRHH